MRWTVSRRIAAGFAVGLSLVAMIAVVGIIALRRSTTAYRATLGQARHTLVLELQAESESRAATLEFLRFLIRPDEQYSRRRDSVFASATALLRDLRDSAETGEIRSLWEQALALQTEENDAARASIEAARAGRQDEALRIRDTRHVPARQAVQEAIRRGVAAGEQWTDAAILAAHATGVRMQAVLLVGGLVALAVGVITAVLLARYAGTLEDRLRSVLNSVPDVLFSMSRDGGQVHYISPAAMQVFGYEAEEVLADTDVWYQRVSLEDGASVRASQEQAVATGQSQTVEYRFRHRDESVRWIETTFVPVSDGRGVVSRVDGISRDVTQQRRLEEQFRQAQKMEAVGRLAAGVAHDFNNLLTVITSYSELLLSDLESTDPRRADLEEIRKAAAGAAGLTRQLLAFSRQQVLEPQVLDLNTIVSGAGKMLQRLLEEDVGLVTVIAPDLGAVKADPGQFEQVIMNLAVNARDAMPEGGKLTIETANVELDSAYTMEHTPVSPGPYVLLTVSDSGVGMDEETQRRIFEPFFTTKEMGKGTGLGLSTVYGIVKQSGGFIWVYSEPGHGTTFKVYLPRVEEQADAEQRGTALPQSVHGTETVLLAEDAGPLRAVARQILKRNGYTVLEAPDGKSALDEAAAHNGPIHLLITDVIMPEMSGRQLAERLREGRPALKVLFVSGYTDDAIIRHGILGPGIAFLQKPFSPESLARKVRAVLDSPQPQ